MRSVKQYLGNTSAAIAIVAALAMPLVIGVSGAAVDYAHVYLVQQRLAQAIDAAALAATASSSEADVIKQKVKDFFAANYSEEKIGTTFDPVVEVIGGEVSVSATARYDTFFLDIFNVDTIDVYAQTVVVREIKGLEVVLVLDNTGSMGTNNNIGKLRTASCEFVEILYGTYDSEDVQDCLDRYGDFVVPKNEHVKVGLVPYSTSVNVGPYGLGYDDDGAVYDTAFMSNPIGASFSNDGDTDLCIIEGDDGSDVSDHTGPWSMYRWCRDAGDDSARCNYYTNYICDGNEYNSSGSSCLDWDYSYGAKTVYRAPYYRCPKASVLPLTNDMSSLKDRINEMEASGWTFGNIGMVWGWRVLSPGAPFTEGVEFNNAAWRKVIVMMTDGDNVRSSPYGAYGVNADHDVNSSGDLDDRLEDVCENMDAQDNVTVYTITFEASSGGIDDATETLYKNCAGNGGYHSHVTSSDELVDVFRGIAQELSNLHIKK
ncbi:MAG: pilus assembly protein TadG-related protein [Alphaproteobacteria bacterium]